MFSIFPANSPKTVLDAARVAELSFCAMAEKSKPEISFEKNLLSFFASSGFEASHLACSAFFAAAIFIRSAFLVS